MADGKRKKIHLYHQPRTTKEEGVVNYYSLAVCSKENGKNMKKVLQYLGRLSAVEAENYKLLLRALNSNQSAAHLVDIHDIVVAEEKKYFDSLILNHLWDQLGLTDIFDSKIKANQSLSTEHIARILTINRLLDPASKIGTIPWLNKTLLPSIMKIESEHYTKNKIFNELSKIHEAKPEIEKLFWKFSKDNSTTKYDVYYFDGSTSWFEGTECPLSKYALEKTRSFYPQVVGLMLVTDAKGYPVAWEVVSGDKKDSTEFRPLAERVRKQYNIKEITYCFDRGVASLANFNDIEKHQSKFISGIKDNQIGKVFNLNSFLDVREKILDYCNLPREEQKDQLPIDDFYSANKNVFYRDLGIVEEKRYVVSFNVQIYHVESTDRAKRINDASIAISELNHIFANRKKNLEYDDAEKQLKEILVKYRVNKFFSYTLIPTVLNKEIESYRTEIKLHDDQISEAGRTDGMMVYITDHIEKQSDQTNFQLSAAHIIHHYKNKYVVENTFREVKSFLDIRPFHVWSEEHVKAHFDIGIIACFINNYIYQQLSASRRNFEQFLNLIKDQFPLDVEQVKEYSKTNKLSLKEINDCDKMALFISKISPAQKLSDNFLNAIDDYGQPASIRKFYAAVADNANVVKLLSPQKTEIYKMKPLGPQIKGYLSRLDMTLLALPSAHTSIRIYQ